MEIIDRSIVFQNADPSSAQVNCICPSLALLSDGRLLNVHRVGSAKDTADGTIFLSESCDGGKTWTGLGTPFEKNLAGVPGELRCAGIIELEPGRLLANLLWVDRSIPNRPFFHPETEGLLPVKILLSESTDGARSWGPYCLLDVSPLIQPASTGPILRLQDNSLLSSFETNKEYNDTSPWHHQAAGIFSTDEGQTWRDPTVFASDPTGRLFYWDQRISLLPDGSLIDLFWTYDRVEKKDTEMHVSWSRDHGRTWSLPDSTGIQGQIAYPIPLSDGRIMMVYVHRHDPPSLRARMSEDGGKSWDAEEELVFHRQGEDRTGAAEGATAMKDYLQEMELWSFGHPSGLQISEKEVLVIYYAGVGDVTGIHVAKLKI